MSFKSLNTTWTRSSFFHKVLTSDLFFLLTLQKDPQYAHLNLEPGRQVSPGAAPRSRAVPTVYATLDTRRPHSHVTFDLRPSHSQASLGHELGYGEDSIHDLAYQHISHDTGRPLLADDATSGTALVAKRESSV